MRIRALPACIWALCGLGAGLGCTAKPIDLGDLPPVETGPGPQQGGSDGGIDAAATDGEASDGARPGEPPHLSLEAAGVRDVVRLAACAGACIPVVLHVDGGVPPYEIHWDDGVTSRTRSLCPDPTQPRSVVVLDDSGGRNSPATLGLPPVDATSNGCGDDGGWTVCQRASFVQDDCGGDGTTLSIDMGRSLSAGSMVEGWALVSNEAYGMSLDFWVSDAACGAEEPFGSGAAFDLDEGSEVARLRFGPQTVQVDWRHLVITARPIPGPLGPLGPSTPGAAPSHALAVQLCEHGLTAQ